MAQIFQKLRELKIDLAPTVLFKPVLTRQPSVAENGLLVGYFATKPEQVNFEFAFQMVGGDWQLFGLRVDTAPAPTAAAPGKGDRPTRPPPNRHPTIRPKSQPEKPFRSPLGARRPKPRGRTHPVLPRSNRTTLRGGHSATGASRAEPNSWISKQESAMEPRCTAAGALAGWCILALEA